MAHKLPYVHATKLISTTLDRIIEAPTPPKFTIDFLKQKLGIKTSSARAIPTLLIKLGFLTQDRIPTIAYNEFRNSSISKAVMANAIKNAFSELYECAEYAHDLNDQELKSLVIQVTGLDASSSTLNGIVGTFKALKEYADFNALETEIIDKQNDKIERINTSNESTNKITGEQSVGMNLSYTINLNLPETTDINVFNAIFKSLKENLL